MMSEMMRKKKTKQSMKQMQRDVTAQYTAKTSVQAVYWKVNTSLALANAQFWVLVTL